MKRVLPLLLLALSCLDFERRVSNCFDGGVCAVRSDADGGADSGSDAGNDAGSNVSADAGTPDASVFIAFAAGFFCSDEWCWESPFPHGVDLTAVFAEGDDLIVAGEHSMVAERHDGGWRSLQGQFPANVNFLSSWGTSFDDVWLTGDGKAWRRTDGGWSTVGDMFNGGNTQAVTGSAAGVFVSSVSDVFKLAGDTWVEFASVPGTEVRSLVTAFGAVHGTAQRSPGAGAVVNFATDASWEFDMGATFTMFATQTSLFVTGERTVELDPTLRFQRQLPEVIVAGTQWNGQLFGATINRVGRVVDGGVISEGQVFIPLRDMASGSTVVAVGDNGSILERRGSSWVEQSSRATRSDVRAFVEFNGALRAITGDCEVLTRGASSWSVSARPLTDTCSDATVDGDSLVLLTTSARLVTLDTRLRQSDQRSLGEGLEARRLWRSDAGLVVTTDQDVFIRRAGQTVESLGGDGGFGAWGVSVKGSVARLCGLDGGAVIDLDLTSSSLRPVPVPGLVAAGCRAVLPLKGGGWALTERNVDGGTDSLKVVEANGRVSEVGIGLSDSFAETLLEQEHGIAVAADRYVFIDTTTPLLMTVDKPARFSGVQALAEWRGRLFVGGAGGSILQAPRPDVRP